MQDFRGGTKKLSDISDEIICTISIEFIICSLF